MAKDKYTATWVSHSSIGDFLKCPQAYYLKHVYRDPKTGHKIKIISPPLSLGQAVHEVLESLSVLPTNKRFREPLINKFEQIWQKLSGEKGGFTNTDIEAKYKDRGKRMLKRVSDNPGPLTKLAVKIKMNLPHFWLSEKDNIILCGKIDWLEYLPDSDSVHIIDFKTGKGTESPDSLQLPIYGLLVQNCQNYKIAKASYWYLERRNKPVEQPLPDLKKSRQKILSIAKKIKLARQLKVFKCPHKNGCRACQPMEAVVRGEGKLVGTGSFKEDVYILDRLPDEEKKDGLLL